MFSFLLKAYSVALFDFPVMNSNYSTDRPFEFETFDDHNISVAIDTPNGLMAPNIKRVQNKSIRELQDELFKLRALAVESRLGPNELFGGTIAMSNIGSIGGTYTGPVNLPNQSCITGIGRIREQPGFVNPVHHQGKTLYDVEMKKVVK